MSVFYDQEEHAVHILVPGKPVAQGRPRFAKHGSFVTAYDPKKSKDYKTQIQQEIQPLFGRGSGFVPFTEACLMILCVYREVPKHFSKKKLELAEQGRLRPTTKPDTDNYLKGVLDALNGFIFKDDSQVVEITAKKYYSCNPRIEVTIVEI